jgi:hypothetical protein
MVFFSALGCEGLVGALRLASSSSTPMEPIHLVTYFCAEPALTVIAIICAGVEARPAPGRQGRRQADAGFAGHDGALSAPASASPTGSLLYRPLRLRGADTGPKFCAL